MYSVGSQGCNKHYKYVSCRWSPEKTHISSSWQPMVIIGPSVTRPCQAWMSTSATPVTYIWITNYTMIYFIGSVPMHWPVPHCLFIVLHVVLFIYYHELDICKWTSQLYIYIYNSFSFFHLKQSLSLYFSRSFSNLFQSVTASTFTNGAPYSILFDGISS